MTTEVVIAVITSIVAILTAITSAYFSYFSQLRATRLEHQLAAQREARSVEAQANLLISKYRNPLLSTAFDLQGRLYNIIRLDFLQTFCHGSKQDREYAINSTLYVIAEYLGWVEIVRREVQFLDLGDTESNQKLNTLLATINLAFASNKMESTFRLFRGEQRAVGELMLTERRTTDTKGLECIGFAEFSRRLEDPEFARWFDRLKDGAEQLAETTKGQEQRLITLQHSLIDLIDFLDPQHVRIPATYRDKI